MRSLLKYGCRPKVQLKTLTLKSINRSFLSHFQGGSTSAILHKLQSLDYKQPPATEQLGSWSTTSASSTTSD